MVDFKNLDVGAQLIKTEGPGSFITKQFFRLNSGKTIVWASRKHRKGIESNTLNDLESFGKAFWNGFSNPSKLNWWISIVFAMGSTLFMVGSVLALSPDLATYFQLNTLQVNRVFFLGSIPFSTAAFLQLYQATKATQFTYIGPKKTFKQSRFVKYFYSIAWLSAGLQFIGTLLFNMNTFNGMNSSLDWLHADIEIWIPDFIGSLFFLISGYLAFIEVTHAYWKSEFNNISWWVVFINLLGCVFFLISACYSFMPKTGTSSFDINTALLFTFIGALCFLLGSLLMLPEAGMKKSEAK